MTKEMIISSSAHETRVAILEDDLVAEIFVERVEMDAERLLLEVRLANVSLKVVNDNVESALAALLLLFVVLLNFVPVGYFLTKSHNF